MTRSIHLPQHRVFVPDTDLVTVALCMLAGGDPYAPAVNDDGDAPAHHQVFNYVTSTHTLVPAGPGVDRAHTANSTLIAPLLRRMRGAVGTGMFGVLDAFTLEHVTQHSGGGAAAFNATKHLTLTIGVTAYSTPLSLYGTTSFGSSIMTTWAHDDTLHATDTTMRNAAKELLLVGIATPAPHGHIIADTDGIIAVGGPSHEPSLRGWNSLVADHIPDSDPIWSIGGYTAGDDYAADMAYATYTTRAAARAFTINL